MAKKTKVTTLGTNYPVPQSREDAASAIAEIGARNRDLARITTAMNDRIAKVKEEAEVKAQPIRERVSALTEGLRIWAEANRLDLTGGKTKTADLGTGTISWRNRPPKVSMPKAKDAIAEILKRARELGFARFVRVTEEPNREAMQAEPDLARTIPGVKIGSAGEDFTVEPFEVELSAGGSANV